MSIESATNMFLCFIMLGFTAITAAATIIAINNMFSRWWKPIQWSVYTWIDEHTSRNPDFQHPKQPDLVPTPVDPHTPWPAPRSTKKVDAKA
jgi:hypothetical protein